MIPLNRDQKIHWFGHIALMMLATQQVLQYKARGMTGIEAEMHRKNVAKGKVPGDKWVRPTREMVQEAVIMVHTDPNIVDAVTDRIMHSFDITDANRRAIAKETNY